ncbi:MAG: LCP family protein [Clostridiales bacterium]
MRKIGTFMFRLSAFFAIILFGIGCIQIYNILNYDDSKDNEESSKEKNEIKELLEPKNYKTLNHPINVLIIGGDAFEEKNKKNTDTLMLANYNPKNSQINLFSIPRDTYVTYNNYSYKINSVYAKVNSEDVDYKGNEKGCIALKELVSEFLNVKIDNYVFISADVFSDIIDELDGVEYNIPCRMIYQDLEQGLDINLKKGKQKLNGKQAEGLVRFRKAVSQFYSNKEEFNEAFNYYNLKSDITRIETQQNFTKELIKQKSKISSISKIDELTEIVFEKLSTDLKLSIFTGITVRAKNINADTINNFTLHTTPMGNTTNLLPTENAINNKTNDIIKITDIIRDYFSTEKNHKY